MSIHSCQLMNQNTLYERNNRPRNRLTSTCQLREERQLWIVELCVKLSSAVSLLLPLFFFGALCLCKCLIV